MVILLEFGSQGGADEADRRAYQLAKQQPVDELEVAVQAVAMALTSHVTSPRDAA